MTIPFEQCPYLTSTAEFVTYFDFSYAPALLFYAYIPISILSLSFGLFILLQNRFALLNKILFLISAFFFLFLVNEIIQWIAVYANIIYFSWSLSPLLQVMIWSLSVYFVYIFIYKKDMTFSGKLILLLLSSPIAILTPTRFNIQSFDSINCEAISGYLWYYLYIFEILLILAISFLCFNKYFSKKLDSSSKAKIRIIAPGFILFLGIFFVSNISGELTKIYQINLIGPIGMIAFLAMLSYLIVKFRSFSAKLFTSQVLVITLWLILAALLFIANITYIRVVVILTLILVGIIGFNLIKSVKREIEQREKIEKLAKDLEKANEQLRELDRQKDELLGIIAHQLATPVSSVRWSLEMMMDGDLGKLTKDQSESVKSLQGITENLSDLVSMILDVSRIQLGRMKVDQQELDLASFFKEILEVIQPKAKEKQVQFHSSLPKKFPKAMLDKRYTHMTIENLLSNAVKYTPKGGDVNFDVSIKGNTMSCTVKDTGIGIPKQEQDKIFGKMFRASNVRNTVDGNGFGLYVAKGAIEAQGGKIWFKSTEGKGTTFFVELPLKQKGVKTSS